jgi:hypothetical protein
LRNSTSYRCKVNKSTLGPQVRKRIEQRKRDEKKGKTNGKRINTAETEERMVDIQDGEAKVDLTRIYYLYDEERLPQTFQAEEWINDKYGLNKKKTKLSRVSGKFRRKTIDRKDFIFNNFTKLLTE